MTTKTTTDRISDAALLFIKVMANPFGLILFLLMILLAVTVSPLFS